MGSLPWLAVLLALPVCVACSPGQPDVRLADGFVELVFKKQFDVGIRQVQFSHDESLLVAATDTFSGQPKDFANPSAHFRAYRLADGVQVAGPAKTDYPPGFDPTLAVNVGTDEPYEFAITAKGTVFAPTGGYVYNPQRTFEPSQALRFSLTPPDNVVPDLARKTLLEIATNNARPIPTPNLLFELGDKLIVARTGYSCVSWTELEAAERSDKVNISGQFCGMPQAAPENILIKKISVSPQSDFIAIAYLDRLDRFTNHLSIYDIKNNRIVNKFAINGDPEELTFLTNGVVLKTIRPTTVQSADFLEWNSVPPDNVRMSFFEFSDGEFNNNYSSFFKDNYLLYFAFTKCAMVSSDLETSVPFFVQNTSVFSGKERMSWKTAINRSRSLFTIMKRDNTVSVFKISKKICSEHL